MKLVFAGTPQFAAAALDALISARHRIACVLTRADRRAGRGLHERESAVKQVALAHNLPIMQPLTLRDEGLVRELAAFEADIMVVAAYGLLLPAPVLAGPRLGCVNVHASLLPRWRGAAPIERAILAGDTTSGISIMQMDAGLDTGPVLLQRSVPIGETDTAAMLHDRLAALGATCIVDALAGLEIGAFSPVPQDETRAVYAAKIDKPEARIEWRESAQQLNRKVRAFDPAPGAYCMIRGAPLKIWRATALSTRAGRPGTVEEVGADFFSVACGEGVLRVEQAQRAGGKRMNVAELLRGFALKSGDRLD